jgi:hypothetical protein
MFGLFLPPKKDISKVFKTEVGRSSWLAGWLERTVMEVLEIENEV